MAAPYSTDASKMSSATPAGENEMQTLARELPRPVVDEIDGHGTVLSLPDKWRIADLDDRLPAPRRAKGVARLDDTDSFVDYLLRIGSASGVIYCTADYDKGRVEFRAVLNGPTGVDKPGWGDFGAFYQALPSVEWRRWTDANAKRMPQVTFAAFIEDNNRDIVGVPGGGMPTGAQMLELALNMEATQDARFKSAVRLQSGGVDLVYVDKENDETLRKMRAFERFAIGIPFVLNGDNYQVNARLRYQVKEGAVAFWYELIRPDLVVRDATLSMVAAIKERTGLPVYYGSHAASFTAHVDR